ncbi:hypothetical protein NQ314_005379 [Rhamnusium bicolor]|uniref:PiggyBac transposable element-derived protein domain-containing protein n=1 Tax=Rhamnusium bicolor TaxID=1586634 RepID=A0AAV8ZH82_9CUCU|nr:hypothetical protein NQ314_005379 [Rhamnusium bicolor]
MLCDEPGEYNSRFQVYTGREKDCKEKGLASRVVIDLCQNFTGKNHLLFFENFFNGYDILITLKKSQIYACGTIRSGRKYLPSLSDEKKLKRGDFDWKQRNEGVTYFRWNDIETVQFFE